MNHECGDTEHDMNDNTHPTTHTHPPSVTSKPLKDPVCGMPVTDKSWHTYAHEGRAYYFCSADCKNRFSAKPGRFAAAKSALQ